MILYYLVKLYNILDSVKEQMVENMEDHMEAITATFSSKIHQGLRRYWTSNYI